MTHDFMFAIFLGAPVLCGANTNRIEELVHAFTLEARAGLPALRTDPVLSLIARAHSSDMIKNAYFDHRNREGLLPQDRTANAHRQLIGVVAENLWSCEHCGDDAVRIAKMAVMGWLDSPGHRTNLLGPSATHVGIGVWTDGRSVHITQLLASVQGYATEPVPAQVFKWGRLRANVIGVNGSPEYLDLEDQNTKTSIGRATPAAGLPLANLPSGAYRLRFWFRSEKQGLLIYPGPAIWLD